MLGLCEVRITSQADFPKARSAAQPNSLIEIRGRMLVTGTIAAAIDQVQWFVCIGQ